MKNKVLIAVILAALALTFSLEAIKHNHSAFNDKWQVQLRPRVVIVIRSLDAQGINTAPAKALCLKSYMTANEADACIDELQREVNLPTNIQ